MIGKLSLFVVTLAGLSIAQNPKEKLLSRHYKEGEQLNYLMKGKNDGWTYEVHMVAVIKKDPSGKFFEEYAWTDLISDGKQKPLSLLGQQFRQAVTLEGGGAPFSPPDLAKAPGLTGPVLDLVTFYADLFLAIHGGDLRKAGDHIYFSSPRNGSWADGRRTLIGEDAVDFDITLVEVDESERVARLRVRHVPPKELKVRLPAAWMQKPIADTPNNFVQVVKAGDKYAASVGKETFDVELKISLVDGKILSATMDNPVEKITRECADAALADCDEPRRDPILRRIEMSLVD